MPTPPVHPRLAGAADLPALAALYADCARQLGPRVYSPQQVQAWVSFGTPGAAFEGYVLGASTWVQDAAGGTPLGFCGVDAVGEVHSLYVAVAAQRQGLGAALLAHALARARQRGVQRFGAWATPFSRPLFERAGLPLVRVVTEPFQGVLFDRFRMETP